MAGFSGSCLPFFNIFDAVTVGIDISQHRGFAVALCGETEP